MDASLCILTKPQQATLRILFLSELHVELFSGVVGGDSFEHWNGLILTFGHRESL